MNKIVLTENFVQSLFKESHQNRSCLKPKDFNKLKERQLERNFKELNLHNSVLVNPRISQYIGRKNSEIVKENRKIKQSLSGSLQQFMSKYNKQKKRIKNDILSNYGVSQSVDKQPDLKKHVLMKLQSSVQKVKNIRNSAIVTHSKHLLKEKKYNRLMKQLKKTSMAKKEVFFNQVDNFIPSSLEYSKDYIYKKKKEVTERKEVESEDKIEKRRFDSIMTNDSRYFISSKQSFQTFQSHQTRFFDSASKRKRTYMG